MNDLEKLLTVWNGGDLQGACAKLCALAPLSPRTLQRWLRGAGQPTAHELQRLAALLKLPAQALEECFIPAHPASSALPRAVAFDHEVLCTLSLSAAPAGTRILIEIHGRRFMPHLREGELLLAQLTPQLYQTGVCLVWRQGRCLLLVKEPSGLFHTLGKRARPAEGGRILGWGTHKIVPLYPENGT